MAKDNAKSLPDDVECDEPEKQLLVQAFHLRGICTNVVWDSFWQKIFEEIDSGE